MSQSLRYLCDRRAILKRYDTALAKGQPAGLVARALLSNTYRKAMQRLEADFWQDHDGLAVLKGRTFVVDQLLRLSMDMLFPEVKPSLTLAATGGYGRQELAPQSDVDIVILLEQEPDASLNESLQLLLALWWDMPWKLSHAVRLQGEMINACQLDVTIQTALLDARFIYGSQESFAQEWWAFYEGVRAHNVAFMQAKLDEQRRRHAQVRYAYGAVQPNLKEGEGGLRDAHTLWWLAKARAPLADAEGLVGEGWFTVAQGQAWHNALSILQRYRCAVHFLKEKPDDILDFPTQSQIAVRFHAAEQGNKAVDSIMGEVRAAMHIVATIDGMVTTTLAHSAKHQAILELEADENMATHPEAWFRVFARACAQKAMPSATILQAIADAMPKFAPTPACYSGFLDVLCCAHNPEACLHVMSRLGLIGWLLPDYARIVGKMQYDMYHVYTVDYHTLKAVSVMHGVCEGGLEEALPLSTRLMNEVADRKILYMAIFLHDIAKGRGGDHSELGADVARQVCPLFGFDSDDTELVAWLVAQHLTMSFYAFKRDSHDPETIIHFAHVVGTVERLRYLLIVTAVDMRATNPSLLSSWKAELLRELYFATENLLTGGLLTFGREAATATSIAKLSSWAAEANPAAAALVERWPEAYWLSTSYAQQQEHLQRLYRHHTQSAQVSIHANTMTDKDVTELTIISPDTAGLFARIARYLTQQQVSIVDARLYTLRDGTVYDLVQVQSQGKALWPDHASRLAERLQGILSKPVSVAKPPVTRGNAALQVAIDNKSSADYTIIEVTGDDRVGLLADLAECLHALGLSINRARIATFAGRAVDVFYVCTLSGEKVLDKEALSTIKTALAEVR